MAAPREVIDLIERFERNHDVYRSHNYNETETRREFIDPFFKALGWDIDNEQGYAEAYENVLQEDAIKTGKATKALNYASWISFSDPAAAGSVYCAMIAVRQCFYQVVTDYPSLTIRGFNRTSGGEV